MGELSSVRDFMLIAKAAQDDSDFHQRFRAALRLAAVSYPQIAWRADFDLGPREHVDIFSAPDRGAARELSEMLNRICDVRVELAPLRNGW
jgi:hypothetical protein